MADVKSILVIEDNDRIRRYYSDHLRLISPDYVVIEATTGRTGLDLYQTHAIDCVILDLSLPDMSGFEVLARLVPVACRPPVPVVILTSIETLALLKVGVLNGAYLALQKDLTNGADLNIAVLRALASIPVDRQKAAA